MKTQKKALYLENFLLISLVQTFFIIQKRDDNGELIKFGHYMLPRRETLLSQPKDEKVILWVTMLLFAQKQMIGSCV